MIATKRVESVLFKKQLGEASVELLIDSLEITKKKAAGE